MKNNLVHRCAVGLAIGTVTVILTGAIITSSEGLPSASPLQAPDWALSLHRVIAELLSLLTAGLCLWILLKERHAGLRITAGATLLVWLAQVGLGEAVLGAAAYSAPTAPGVGLFHAFLAQLLMAGTVVLALLTAPAWDSAGDSSGEPASFRWLALVIVVLVLAQVLLGDAYRHGAMGVILHILNAMIVALVIFVSGMVLTRKSSEPTLTRSTAVALMIITGIQVMLGFAAFILLLMLKPTSTAVVVVSVAHVATGALTLAASVAFAIVVRREVVPTPASTGGLEPRPSHTQS